MSCRFENIFEKYNLRRDISRKRYRRTHSSNFNGKSLPILSRSEAANSISCRLPNNSSCYLNKHSTAKYNIPTRYNRLETIKVDSGVKLQSCSLTEYIPLDKSGQCKENGKNPSAFAEQNQSSHRRICDTFGADCVGQTKTALCSIGNINNIKQTNTSDNKHLIKSNADASFEMNETNFNLTESSFPKFSESENTERFTSQINENGSSELDLLINLIEQDEPYIKKQHTRDRQSGKILNCDDRLLVTQRRLKGGYQEMFEHSLKRDKGKSNFLKYDKKLGLRIGHLLTVVKIEAFHGITLAIVKSQNLNKNFAVVVSREMSLRLKLGDQIEAFFDDNTLPYKLLVNGEYFEVYLEPYKLICI